MSRYAPGQVHTRRHQCHRLRRQQIQRGCRRHCRCMGRASRLHTHTRSERDTHGGTYACHACARTHSCTGTHACWHTRVCMRAHAGAHMPEGMCAHTNTHTHTNTHRYGMSLMVTVGAVAGTGLKAFTFDAPAASYGYLNTPHTGYASITVTGLNFAAFDYTYTQVRACTCMLHRERGRQRQRVVCAQVNVHMHTHSSTDHAYIHACTHIYIYPHRHWQRTSVCHRLGRLAHLSCAAQPTTISIFMRRCERHCIDICMALCTDLCTDMCL